MKGGKNLFLLGACCVLGAGLTYYTGEGGTFGVSVKPQAALTSTAELSLPAPQFSFTTLDEQTYSLSIFKGKGIVLNIWASWCAPCVIEFPQMIDLADGRQKDTVFIFLSIDEDKDDVQRFLKKHAQEKLPSNVVIAHDPTQKIARDLFQTYKLPETFLIDSAGILRDKIVGANEDWTGTKMNERIDVLSP